VAPPSQRIRSKPASITRSNTMSVAAMEMRGSVVSSALLTRHVSCVGAHVERSYGCNEVGGCKMIGTYYGRSLAQYLLPNGYMI